MPVNPFKHVGNVVGGMWNDAAQSDCATGPAKFAVAVVTPIVVPVAFIAALFKKGNTVAAVPLFLFAVAMASMQAQVMDRGQCVKAYDNAWRSIDAVYGIVPGVSADDQLRDSIALNDAAEQVRVNSGAAERLCSAGQVSELQAMAARLRATRDRYDKDREPYRLAVIVDRAAMAVRDAEAH